MSVPEQIPYVGYVANGQTTEFPITFDLHDPKYLIVTVNKEIPVIGTYTVDLNALKVVFATAPTDGTQVELYRETELNRDTNYQKYDNSFRPETVNYDFDKIWHVLQEQDMIDAELLARLKREIEWRRTHDANFDELAKMRDAQVFSGLKQYLDTILAMTNPNIFDGITAGIVFALDKKSVQTHIELIYAQLTENRLSIIAEKNRALAAEANLQSLINSNGVGNRAYLTYVSMTSDATNIPANSKTTVTNDTDPSKNGDYQYDGSVFTKSIYDPVSQARKYADQTKVDKSQIGYMYENGNMVGSRTRAIENYGLNSSLAVVNQSAYQSKIIPVNVGDDLFVLNNLQDYAAPNGHGYTFFAEDPILVTANNPSIFGTRTEKTDTATGLKYSAVTVPSNAKYLMFNTRFNTSNISWSIHIGSFSASYDQGTESVFSINDVELHKQLSNEIARDLAKGNAIEGDYYDKSKILNGYYLGADGTLQPYGPWSAYKFNVSDGDTYFMKILGGTAWTKKFVYSKNTETVNSDSYVSDVSLVLTDIENVYKFTVPTGQDIKAVFLNIKIADDFDLTNTLSIQKYYFDADVIGVSDKAIARIGGSKLIDGKARQMLANLDTSASNSRFKNKKFYCFGDSITEGTQGGYAGYIANKLGANVTNYGSSGAQAGRLVSIMTGQPNRQESGNEHTAPDYSNVSGISIMIGTNHTWQDPSTLGSISEVPTSKVTDFTNPNDYWALFPNKFVTNLALCIEYVKWKNKELEIHLITPPYKVDATEGANNVAKLIPAIEAVAKFYSVHLIYATYESGLAYKNLDTYTYDGTHLSTLGNKVFGNFVANKILYL